jgi:hypothetical protein
MTWPTTKIIALRVTVIGRQRHSATGHSIDTTAPLA